MGTLYAIEMRILFTLILCISYLSINSQNNTKPVIFLNENLKPIDEITYSNKLLKDIYREDIINKDSIKIKKLRKLYEFDSLNQIELKQVQNILTKYLNISDFNKSIIIVYRDSLLGYTEYNQSFNHRKMFDATKLVTKKSYNKARKKYDSNQKKCRKFSNKYNTNIIYGFSESVNFTYNPKHYKNTKIPDVLKSIFFKNKRRGTLILKPNGQYFYFSFLTQKQIIKMLNSDWKPYIKDYQSIMSNDDVYSMKFINDMHKQDKLDNSELAKNQLNEKRIKFDKYQSPRNLNIIVKKPYNCFGFASY